MNRFLRCFRIALWIGFLAQLGVPAFAQALTQVRLLVDREAVKPGEQFTAGVELQMPQGWHTYWRNPSESGGAGLRTKVDWTLPEGFKAGEVLWPTPAKHADPAGDAHSYEGTVLLLVPISVASTAAIGSSELKAKVSWLECASNCVPGRVTVSASLSVGTQSLPSSHAAAIAATRAKLPATDAKLDVRAYWEDPAGSEPRKLLIEWKTDAPTGDFFAYEGPHAALSAHTEVVKIDPGTGVIRLRKTVAKLESGYPTEVRGLLVANPGTATERAFESTVTIGEAPTGAVAGAKTEPFSFATLIPMLGLAFIGGLILNIMPCVLPVLALKILGFVRQAGSDPGRVRKLGLIYGAGVITSFLVLAGVALAVQAAGGVAGWSTAFQNPQFRVLMCILLVLVALNLFGVFEVTLSGGAMGVAGDLTSKEGGAGAFFNGVLAAVLATPCTAPFLATAIGFAFTQPPIVLLSIFLTVGLGLAAPFVVLCWKPGWLKLMPKPGAWMVRFKVAMGFPLLGTAIWVFWFTAGRLGSAGVLWMGLLLVLVSAAAWVWGEFGQKDGKTVGAGITALALLLVGYFGILEGQLDWRTSPGSRKPKVDWQPWSQSAVAKAVSEGRPVLVDFTADGCLNCQINKRTSIEIKSTADLIRSQKVAALEGDFTDLDPAIAAELQKFGRRGVPLVLVYSKDPSKPPRVLPTVLTPGVVKEALEWAAQ
jgi:thiol:disulfide interchange protein DsbD